MERAVDNSSDPAFALDEGMRILAWNRHADRLFGFTEAQAIGQRCYDILKARLPSGEPLCGPDCHGSLCFRIGRPFGIDECVVTIRGARPVRVALSSLLLPEKPGADGKRRCILVFVHPLDPIVSGEALPRPFRLHMLGGFTVTKNERHVPLERWHRRAAVTLLKLLAMRRGHVVPGEFLIEHIWPGVELPQGRQRLKIAVYYARRELQSVTVIRRNHAGYVLAEDETWLDVVAFEEHVAAGTRHFRFGQIEAAIDSFNQALDLYRGDLFEDDPYADWCAEERERLREVYFNAAKHLADLQLHRQPGEAERVCRRALMREPCREQFHRKLIEALLAQARPEEAEQQFHRCRAVLSRELDVEPMPETWRVFEKAQAMRR